MSFVLISEDRVTWWRPRGVIKMYNFEMNEIQLKLPTATILSFSLASHLIDCRSGTPFLSPGRQTNQRVNVHRVK